MERFQTRLAVLGLTCFLTGCTDLESPFSQKGISRVNNQVPNEAQSRRISIKQVSRVVRGVNSAGQPTVSILVDSNNCHPFDITLLRSNIRTGYTVHSQSYSHPEIELMTRWSGGQFTQSRNFPTTVVLNIQSLTQKEAVLSFSGLLVNEATGSYVRLAPSQVALTGKHLEEFLVGH